MFSYGLRFGLISGERYADIKRVLAVWTKDSISRRWELVEKSSLVLGKKHASVKLSIAKLRQDRGT